ncbi:putative transporter ESBP6 [Nakaseomyces bracarensis]|uniref:Transporter ESBP6 n=1 Tax=Nakaseomyces bracarensis TaxID=273131 RepID=A0ABR4NP05_9SACH
MGSKSVWDAMTDDGVSIVETWYPMDFPRSGSRLQEEEDNKILESHFELADAIRLQDNNDLESNESITTLRRVFTVQEDGLDLPPDGGYGWVCVLCVFLAMFSTWGCNAGFGIFLGFYFNNDTFPGATKYDYALIAGLTGALGQGMAPFAMILMRLFGIKGAMLIGDALLLSGFLLASYATKIWQLYLTQGVLAGCSIAVASVPATVVLPGWFLKKRAVAVGLSLLGTGVGGVVYGLAVNKLIQTHGDTKLALRVLAITCSVTVFVAAMLVKERNPRKSVGLRSPSLVLQQFQKMFTINLIRRPQILLVAWWFSFSFLGYVVMVFTLSPYAIARGMTPHNASTLTALLNAAQCIGRPSMGLAGDRFGRINITILLTASLVIFLFAFWIPAHTFVQLIIFSLLVGIGVGVANVFNSVLTADLVEPDMFLPAWAFVCYNSSPLGLVGEVIAQALVIEHTSHVNPYIHTQIFAGCCFVAALLLALALREYSVRLRYQLKLREVIKDIEHLDESLDDKKQYIVSLGKLQELEKSKKYCEVVLAKTMWGYFSRMVKPLVI